MQHRAVVQRTTHLEEVTRMGNGATELFGEFTFDCPRSLLDAQRENGD